MSIFKFLKKSETLIFFMVSSNFFPRFICNFEKWTLKMSKNEILKKVLEKINQSFI